MDDTMRPNSYAKLPPISPGFDSYRLNRSQYLFSLKSVLHNLCFLCKEIRQQAKHNPQGHHQALPLNLPNHSEHFIELPSDIFLSSRTGDDLNLHVEHF
jgi:hypothetical protein